MDRMFQHGTPATKFIVSGIQWHPFKVGGYCTRGTNLHFTPIKREDLFTSKSFQTHSISLYEVISFPQDLIQAFNNPWVRYIPCGSYSGYGTARDLAKLMGILANGGSYNGTSLMSRHTTAMLTDVLTEGDEYVMGRNTLGRGVTPFKSPLVSYNLNHAGGGYLIFLWVEVAAPTP